LEAACPSGSQAATEDVVPPGPVRHLDPRLARTDPDATLTIVPGGQPPRRAQWGAGLGCGARLLAVRRFSYRGASELCATKADAGPQIPSLPGDGRSAQAVQAAAAAAAIGPRAADAEASPMQQATPAPAHRASWIWLVLAVLAVSTAASLFRIAALPALEAAGLRLLLGGLVLGPLAFGGLRQVGTAERRSLALASLALAVHFGSWVESLYLTSVASSVVLVSASPLFTLLWELRAGEEVRGGQWLGAAVGLVGVVVIALSDAGRGGGAIVGDLLALLGAVAFSVYLRAGRQARQSLGLFTYVAPVYATAGLLLLLAQPLAAPVVWPLPPVAWLMTALLVLGPTLIGHTGFNFALREIPASSVAMAALMEPVGAVLIAWPLLHTLPGPGDVVGGLLTIGGLAIFLWSQSQQGGRARSGGAN